ncbi:MULTISPECIES: glycoside hydrolase family 15 protein [unclassified Leifsonia]|uniref:glycoside hydrolase family 15 protein n=1 Tax=unclassified Leifsonia TaxID=2663824 RepID=UPI0006F502C6|nr:MULTISPECIES: glycoside hydrolase family 15 protein [unclassified Leifsonia]KQX07744.1 glucoamylase [Leifsonia sp. Root1293]KRA12026.1 glucoamylase [Leifsonia sp. Root60]
MSLRIEDYALISDCYTGALVGSDGSIDWLCMPRYDSLSQFGALLGSEEHGRWLLAPADAAATSTRRYDGDTMILITHWTTDTGSVEVTDVMPMDDRRANLIRRVKGVTGTVRMKQDLRFRFGHAATVPWLRKDHSEQPASIIAVAGPDSIVVRGPLLHPSGHSHVGEFDVQAGSTVDLSLTWFPAHRDTPPAPDVDAAMLLTHAWWKTWAGDCDHEGPYRPAVVRSLLLLRALTHLQTGGVVAAATTSLPESFGGERNWDYRYVWLRDASLAISVLLTHGYSDYVSSWRGWLLRAVAGDPADLQIMYGLSGERNLAESIITTLPGYKGAAPVRIGNGASTQFQADVIGEVMIALDDARRSGVPDTRFSWALQRSLIKYLEDHWQDPDHGIWEIRGEQQSFTHSRVLVWAAFDRAIHAVEEYGLDGDLTRWRILRETVRADIDENGFDASRNTYTQTYTGPEVDASLLQLAQVGYLDWSDPRMLGTVAAIEADLLRDGLVLRYRTEAGVDGLPGDEHPFLACSFWLVEQYARSGRPDDAIELMDRLVSYANDVGMLSEEYDVAGQTQAGNTPQALTHLTLVRAADAIAVMAPNPDPRLSTAVM